MDYKDIERLGIEVAEDLYNDGFFEPRKEFIAYSSLTEIVKSWIDYKEIDANERDILTVRKYFINHFRQLLETKTSYKTEVVTFNDETYLRIYKGDYVVSKEAVDRVVNDMVADYDHYGPATFNVGNIQVPYMALKRELEDVFNSFTVEYDEKTGFATAVTIFNTETRPHF